MIDASKKQLTKIKTIPYSLINDNTFIESQKSYNSEETTQLNLLFR